jgi:hypothetical protein
VTTDQRYRSGSGCLAAASPTTVHYGFGSRPDVGRVGWYFGGCGGGHAMDSTALRAVNSGYIVQVQVQVCFTSVCGQVQPLDVALSNSV